MEGGISITTALGILFIILKVIGAIDWSWWWVLAPFWIPVVIVGLVLLILIIAGIISIK